jgi:DNA polymerase-3 subunit delta
MKIGLNDLKKVLKENHSSLLFIIASNDEVLALDAFSLLKKSLLSKDYEFGVTIEPQAGFNWQQWEESLLSPSLFSPKELHVLKLKNLKFSAEALRQSIQRLLQFDINRPALIILAPFLLPKDMSKPWVKLMNDNGCLIQCWPIKENDLPRWVKNRAMDMKLDITIKAASILATLCENNLQAADQALKGLSLVFSDTKVDEDSVLDFLDNSSQFDAYKLVDAVLENKAKKAFRVFYNLKRADSQISLIYYAFYRELNLLLNIHEVTHGDSLSASDLEEFGVWRKRQSTILTAYSSLSTDQLYEGIKIIEHIDQALKGVGETNAWDYLSQLLNLMLSGSNKTQVKRKLSYA